MKQLLYSCKTLFICLVFLQSAFVMAQSYITVEGVVYDEFNYPIPYASVGIVAKNIGTSSTEDGGFKFIVTNDELSDTIEISSIGFQSLEITVQDFIALTDKTFVLKEMITELGEVSIENPRDIVKKAVKKLKENTISKKHKLGLLYRRWSVEDSICRYFIEQYMDILDRGPSSYLMDFDVQHSRNSSDYRFIKNEQDRHAIKYMEQNNPLRNGPPMSTYSWKKIDDTFYANEDVIVLKGSKPNGNYIIFYIGFNLTVLAAILAVIGYSLNDTIVVSDRIRENYRKKRKSDNVNVINRSLNQMLGRTLITSLTTLLVLFALLILGGDFIKNFAIALICGVIIGTYSSIYVLCNTLIMLDLNFEDLAIKKSESFDDGMP